MTELQRRLREVALVLQFAALVAEQTVSESALSCEEAAEKIYFPPVLCRYILRCHPGVLSSTEIRGLSPMSSVLWSKVE